MPTKILFVDDEPALHSTIRYLFEYEIEQQEIDLLFALDEAEALEKLYADAEIDIIFIDIHLTRVDGLSLLAKIQRLKPLLNPALTAIVLSDSEEIVDIRRAMNLGAFDFLIKPLDLMDVKATLAKTVEHVRQSKVALKQQRLTAEALRQSEIKIRTLVDTAPDGIIIIDESGVIESINQSAQEIFDYPTSEMVGQDVKLLIPDLFDQVTEKGETRYELMGQRKNGTTFPIEISIGEMLINEQRMYPTFVRDITERKQAEKERLLLLAMQRELAIAQEIQESLLPLSHPDWMGPDIVCFSSPAREIGGDLYAYRAIDEHRFAVAVGDVSGKGMPAALLMAVSLASFQAMVKQGLAPGLMLTRLDRTISLYTRQTRQNCALLYVELDWPNLSLRVANAGGIPPYIKRLDGSVSSLEVGGIPLGVGLGAQFGYREINEHLKTGELIIMISDGVVEAKNMAQQMVGFERLEEIIIAGPQANAEVMLEHIKQEVFHFTQGIELHDDFTIVVLQV